MANPAASIRAQAQSTWPGATVAERGRNWIIHQHPTQPWRRMVDTTIGSLHYQSGASWVEIETDWQDSDDPAFTDTANRSHCKTYAKSDGTYRFYPRRDVATEYIEFGILEYWRTTGGGSWQSLPMGVKNRSLDKLSWDGANVSITLLSDTDRLKLSFILKTASAPTRARWPVTLVGLSLGSDWTLTSVADNVVVANLPQPIMVDSSPTPQTRTLTTTYAGGYIEYDADVTGFTYPIDIDPTVDAQVGAQADSFSWGTWWGGDTFDTTANTGRLGSINNGGGSDIWNGGGRWAITGPAHGDTIDVAYISVDAQLTLSTTVPLRISAVDDDDPAAPTTHAQCDGLTLTTAYVDWSPGAWNGGTWYNSPSLVSVIQEVIDRTGWASGNHMVVVIKDNGSTLGNYRNIYLYSDNSANAEKIHIEYTAAVPSASVSPSISPSASQSPSASVSPSISQSPSLSPSSSASPSPSPGAVGSVCWGHSTGVAEDNVRTFASNWTGTGVISGAGDTEIITLQSTQYMISEIINTGAITIELDYNHYRSGDTTSVSYRHGATPAACVAASWNTYSAPFVCLGYVQVKLENLL